MGRLAATVPKAGDMFRGCDPGTAGVSPSPSCCERPDQVLHCFRNILASRQQDQQGRPNRVIHSLPFAQQLWTYVSEPRGRIRKWRKLNLSRKPKGQDQVKSDPMFYGSHSQDPNPPHLKSASDPSKAGCHDPWILGKDEHLFRVGRRLQAETIAHFRLSLSVPRFVRDVRFGGLRAPDHFLFGLVGNGVPQQKHVAKRYPRVHPN